MKEKRSRCVVVVILHRLPSPSRPRCRSPEMSGMVLRSSAKKKGTRQTPEQAPTPLVCDESEPDQEAISPVNVENDPPSETYAIVPVSLEGDSLSKQPDVPVLTPNPVMPHLPSCEKHVCAKEAETTSPSSSSNTNPISPSLLPDRKSVV